MSSPFNLSPWFTIVLTRISSVFEELISRPATLAGKGLILFCHARMDIQIGAVHSLLINKLQMCTINVTCFASNFVYRYSIWQGSKFVKLPTQVSAKLYFRVHIVDLLS